jgi:hypothetical protein
MDGVEWTPDRIEGELVHLEGLVGQIRARQALLVDEADRLGMPRVDGCRTIVDWVASRLDVSHSTAAELVTVARSLEVDDLSGGELSWDRAVGRRRLERAGASKEALAVSEAMDVAGMYRFIRRHRRFARGDERRAFQERSLRLETSPDGSMTHIWGRLAGVDGPAVAEALSRVGDSLPDPPQGRGSCAQRNADALVALCRGESSPDGSNEPVAVVVVDARLAGPSDAERGVSVLAGPRVGAGALEEILCSGTAEVVAVTAEGVPLGVGTRSAKVPPRLRRFVLARDGGCVADGCSSTYRLQPHHVLERSRGGGHHPDNLLTLCWYHHHVVIHGRGYTIDPASPTGRIRFLPPPPIGPDPP